MIRLYFYLVLQPGMLYAFAQESTGDPNIIIITIDGLCWQEIFNGADKNIIADEKYLDDVQLTQDSWRNAKQNPVYQKQIAATIAGFSGVEFIPEHPVADAIDIASKDD